MTSASARSIPMIRCPAARNATQTAAPIPEAEPLTAVTGIKLSLFSKHQVRSGALASSRSTVGTEQPARPAPVGTPRADAMEAKYLQDMTRTTSSARTTTGERIRLRNAQAPDVWRRLGLVGYTLKTVLHRAGSGATAFRVGELQLRSFDLVDRL